jgi:hypothetical protein
VHEVTARAEIGAWLQARRALAARELPDVRRSPGAAQLPDGRRSAQQHHARAAPVRIEEAEGVGERSARTRHGTVERVRHSSPSSSTPA